MPAITGRLGRVLVARFDTLLRRGHGVFEFTADPACILRIALCRAGTATTLADGTRIAPRDRLVAIHLWNERLPQMPPTGADLAWARRMYRGCSVSLQLLAKYLAFDPRLAAVCAVYGEAGFLTGTSLDAGVGALARLGFELRRPHAQAGPWRRFAEFWQNVYSYALLWTFNPASLQRKPFLRLERCELWMSRAALDARYGVHCL